MIENLFPVRDVTTGEHVRTPLSYDAGVSAAYAFVPRGHRWSVTECDFGDEPPRSRLIHAEGVNDGSGVFHQTLFVQGIAPTSAVGQIGGS